jgi:hypothetical protein
MASLRNTGNTGSVNQKRSLRKILLMGYKNMEKGRKKHTPVKPINLTILQQIRRNLNSTKIGRGTRLAIWAASLLAFWGSFRLAEILPSRRLAFDKFSDLLWNDIQWKKESLLLNIKQPKIPNGWADKVEIFQVSASHFLPSACFKKIKTLLETKGWKLQMQARVQD